MLGSILLIHYVPSVELLWKQGGILVLKAGEGKLTSFPLVPATVQEVLHIDRSQRNFHQLSMAFSQCSPAVISGR